MRLSTVELGGEDTGERGACGGGGAAVRGGEEVVVVASPVASLP